MLFGLVIFIVANFIFNLFEPIFLFVLINLFFPQIIQAIHISVSTNYTFFEPFLALTIHTIT